MGRDRCCGIGRGSSYLGDEKAIEAYSPTRRGSSEGYRPRAETKLPDLDEPTGLDIGPVIKDAPFRKTPDVFY